MSHLKEKMKTSTNEKEDIYLGLSTLEEIEQRFQAMILKNRGKSSGKVTFQFSSPTSSIITPPPTNLKFFSPAKQDQQKKEKQEGRRGNNAKSQGEFVLKSIDKFVGTLDSLPDHGNEQQGWSAIRAKSNSHSEKKEESNSLRQKVLKLIENNKNEDHQSKNLFEFPNKAPFQPTQFRASHLLNNFSTTSSVRGSILASCSVRGSQIDTADQFHSFKIPQSAASLNSKTQRSSQLQRNSKLDFLSKRTSALQVNFANQDQANTQPNTSRNNSKIQVDQKTLNTRKQSISQIHQTPISTLPSSRNSSQRNSKIQMPSHSKEQKKKSSSSKSIQFKTEYKKKNQNLDKSQSSSSSEEVKVNHNNKRRASLFDLIAIQKQTQRQKSVQQLKQSLEEETKRKDKFGQHYYSKDNASELNKAQIENLSQYLYELANQTQQLQQKIGGGSASLDVIFEYFGINKTKLMNLKSGEEKENYIVQSIQKQCAEQLEELIESIQFKSNKFQEQEIKNKSRKEEHANIGEHFKWIKLPCSSPSLKQKLKQSMIEVLYGCDHLSEISSANIAYKKIEQEEKQPLNENLSKSTTFLKIPSNNAQILSQKEDVQIKKSKNKEEQKKKLYVENDEWREGRRLLISKKEKSVSISESILKSFPIKTEKQYLENDAELQNKLMNFEWNSATEKTFGDYRKNAKKVFVGEAKLNKFESIGMQPILRMLGLEEKLDVYRSLLVRKFREEMEPLTLREKEFLINTSLLLNANVNKQEFQEMFEFISNEDIQMLELKIAENILIKYHSISNELKNIRNEFLFNKSKESAQKIKENDMKGNPLDKIKEQINIKIKRKYLKNIIQRTRTMLDAKKERIDYLLNLKRNPYVIHFAKQMKKTIHYLLEAKNKEQEVKKTSTQQAFISRNYSSINQKTLFQIKMNDQYIPVNVRVSQQIYHPTSRVLLGVNEHLQSNDKRSKVETKEKGKNISKLQVQQDANLKAVNDRVKLKQGNKKEQQSSFKQFYSNGPIEVREFKNKMQNIFPPKGGDEDEFPKRPQLHQWIDQKVEHEAATIIQKWIKGRLQFIKFQYFKEDNATFQQKRMVEKLKNWKEQKDLLKFAQEQGRKMIQYRKQCLLRRLNTAKSVVLEPKDFQNADQKLTNDQTTTIMNSPKSMSVSEMQSLVQHAKIQSPYQENQNKQDEEDEVEVEEEQEHENQDEEKSISSINSKASSKQSSKQISHQKIQPHKYKSGQKQRSEDDQATIGGTRSTFDMHSVQFTGRSNVSEGTFTPNSEQISTRILNKKQLTGNHHNQKYQKQIQQRISEQIEKQEDIHIKDHLQPVQNDGCERTENFKKGIFRQRSKEDFLMKQKRLFFAAKQSSLASVFNSGFVFYTQDFNSQDEFNNTPLYYVTQRGDQQFIQYLLTGGADVNIRCQDNSTVLHAAFEKGVVSTIIDIIDHGGDLNAVNNQGMTPLALGKIELLKELKLESGITNVENDKIAKTQYFDNNKLFNETHNVIPEFIKEYNNSPSYLKKRRDFKKPENEIEQSVIGYEYINKLSHHNQEDSKLKGIKSTREIQCSINKINVPIVESFFVKNEGK